MPAVSDYKDDFLLNPDVVFLNHGSFGATPRQVFQVYQQWQEEMERQPVEFLGRKAASLLYQARTQLATYLNSDANDLVFVTNATTGLNIAARSLSLTTGDIVLTTNHEYGAMDRTWRFLSSTSGFEYRQVRIPLPLPDPESILDLYRQTDTSRVKAVFLSHITSPTASILPVKEICRWARQRGILSIIDGAHAPGQIPLDLLDLGADIYCGNLHKWLCAPKGSAFLWVRKEIQPQIRPLIVSWGWECDQPGPSQFVDYLEWLGTRDLSAFLTVPEAIRYQESRDWVKIREGCHELASVAETQLCEDLHRMSIYHTQSQFAQMFAVELPPQLDPIRSKEDLYQDYRIEVPIHKWEDRLLMRVSIQGYNQTEDIGLLRNALSHLIRGEINA